MFSITDAAFTGFRVVRERPVMAAWWTGLNLLFAVLSVVILVGLAGSALNEMMRMDQANPDMSAMLDIWGRLAPAYLILIVVSFIYYGVVYAAANRAVLQPEESRMGYLRFGGAEIKQGLLLLVLGLIIFAAYMGLAIVGAIVMAIFGAIGGTAGAVLGVVLFALIVVSGLLFLSVKLSLASAQTFATGRFNVFGSWSLTKGRFWPILGAFVIAGILTLIIYGIIFGLFAGVLFAAAGMPALTQIFSPDTTSFETILRPANIAYYLLSALVSALTLPIWLTPAAWIYGQIVRTGPDEVFA